jgi:two-component system phosphate regulon sensor histidine kinase PhoR
MIALFFLLGLQSVWLYNTYRLKLTEIKDSINKFFIESIEKELNYRFIFATNRGSSEGLEIALVEYNDNDIEKNGVNSFWFNLTQSFTSEMELPFDLNYLDSLYASTFLQNHLPFAYQLNYTDSLGTVIGSTGKKINDGFKTESVYIVNGNRVQAMVQITAPTIFKHMLGILIASILIFILIVVCLIYEIKMFLNQHYLLELRKNFTHALTHDMKTPLSTIHAILNQLINRDLEDSPDMRNKFGIIATEQVQNLQATVNQILTLAYIDKKQLSLNKQPVDLPETVKSLIDKFTLKGEKLIVFSEKYDLKNETVIADLFYLKNAISNLIDNAVKYSGKSVKIDIECTKNNEKIHIKVKDNGLGIPKEDRQKIFDRFERGAEIKRKNISGFGLGLSYVKRVIEAHNGAISLSSQENIGSEFIITLPVESLPF